MSLFESQLIHGFSKCILQFLGFEFWNLISSYVQDMTCSIFDDWFEETLNIIEIQDYNGHPYTRSWKKKSIV